MLRQFAIVALLVYPLGCGPATTPVGGSAGGSSSAATGEASDGGGRDASSGKSTGPGGGDTGGPETGSPDSGTTTALPCADEPFDVCLDVDRRGGCSDLGFDSRCVDGRQQCRPGQIPAHECLCFNLANLPRCFVGEPDACSDRRVDAVCTGPPAPDGWSCPDGSTPERECDSGGGSSTG